MIEVEMTKDIRDYENKLFGLVTVRQTILLGIGLVYSVPIALLIPAKDVTTKVFIAAGLMSPVILMGWVKVYGMKLEQFVIQAVRSLMLAPSKRKYKTDESSQYMMKELKRVKPDKVKVKKSDKYPAHK